MNNSNPGGQKEEQGIPQWFLDWAKTAAYKEGSSIKYSKFENAPTLFQDAAIAAYRKLSEKRDGPVWVKASERLPDKKVHAKYNEHFGSLMFAYQVWHFNSATYCRTFDPGHEQLQNIYWLDDSPSITRDGEREEGERKYSREELKEALRGLFNPNDWLISFDVWFDRDYPPSTPTVECTAENPCSYCRSTGQPSTLPLKQEEEQAGPDDTLYTHYQIDLENVPLDWDTTICDSLDAVRDVLQFLDIYLDNPDGIASIKITGIGMSRAAYAAWKKEHIND